MTYRDADADARGAMFSSTELDMCGLASSTDTPYSCTRRVPVRWPILTAGEEAFFGAIRGAWDCFSLVRLILAAEFIFGEVPRNSTQINIGQWCHPSFDSSRANCTSVSWVLWPFVLCIHHKSA